jgi:glycosyltransferase involved in cell wall biosynthesis
MSGNTSVSGGRRMRGLSPFQNAIDPTVSVITAVFNAQDCIADCIKSVLTQDYPNIECIIVDGASTDGTVDVIRRYEDKIDIWISEPDNGIFDAWNKGLKLASGKWIAFLGADDIYLPGAIRKYMNLARECSGAEFLSSHAQLIHPSGYSPVFGAPWKWPACARALTTIHVGTMHRRSLFERYGNFDASYRSAGDYEFLLRAGDRLKTAFMPEITVMMRAGGASESTANIYERRRAKTQRGARSATVATLDLMVDIVRFHIRRLILTLWSRLKTLSTKPRIRVL